MSTTTFTTERYGLTQRAALLVAANVAALVMSFALPLVLVRMLSRTEFGLYKQAFQIMASALSLLNLQVAVSVFYFMAREPGKKLQVAMNVLIFYGLLGALVALFFLLYPEWVTLIFQSAELVPHTRLLGFAILFWLVPTGIEGVPIAAGDVRVASVLIVAAQFTKAILMLVAALVFGSITAILWAAIIQGALQTAFLLGYIRHRFGRLLAPIDWPLFKAQLSNALPFGIGGIAAVAQMDLHNYFVSYHFDPATFAIYAVGCFQLPLLGLLTGSLSVALNPEVAQYEKEGNYQGIYLVWVQAMRHLAFFLAPTYALLLLARREFITALFTSDYEASVPIFTINLFSVLLAIMLHLPVLRVFDQLKYVRLKLYLMLLPVTWVALYLGLRTAGLVGIAAAVIFVQALDVAINVTIIGRKLGLQRRDLRRLASLLCPAAAAGIALVVAGLVKLSLAHQSPLLVLVACSAVFGCVYLASALAVGAVTETEKAALRSLWLRLNHAVARRSLASPTEVK